MYKDMRLYILFDMVLNPSFKMTTSFTNFAILSTQLSTIDFYILTKSIASYNKKLLQKSLYILKSEETKSQIKAHLWYLANSYFYNYKPSPRILRQHRVLRNLRKNKDNVITKPDKGHGVLILDGRLYNNAIEEILLDTSKFEKLNKEPTLKRETSLQRFLRKLKGKNFFNEIECNKLYLAGSAVARIYGTPKIHKFSSND